MPMIYNRLSYNQTEICTCPYILENQNDPDMTLPDGHICGNIIPLHRRRGKHDRQSSCYGI